MRIKGLWRLQVHQWYLKLRYVLRFWMIPHNDDADRAYCERVEEIGHWSCGICETNDIPRFMCTCPECNLRHMGGTPA